MYYSVNSFIKIQDGRVFVLRNGKPIPNDNNVCLKTFSRSETILTTGQDLVVLQVFYSIRLMVVFVQFTAEDCSRHGSIIACNIKYGTNVPFEPFACKGAT